MKNTPSIKGETMKNTEKKLSNNLHPIFLRGDHKKILKETIEKLEDLKGRIEFNIQRYAKDNESGRLSVAFDELKDVERNIAIISVLLK